MGLAGDRLVARALPTYPGWVQPKGMMLDPHHGWYLIGPTLGHGTRLLGLECQLFANWKCLNDFSNFSSRQHSQPVMTEQFGRTSRYPFQSWENFLELMWIHKSDVFGKKFSSRLKNNYTSLHKQDSRLNQSHFFNLQHMKTIELLR